MNPHTDNWSRIPELLVVLGIGSFIYWVAAGEGAKPSWFLVWGVGVGAFIIGAVVSEMFGMSAREAAEARRELTAVLDDVAARSPGAGEARRAALEQSEIVRDGSFQ